LVGQTRTFFRTRISIPPIVRRKSQTFSKQASLKIEATIWSLGSVSFFTALMDRRDIKVTLPDGKTTFMIESVPVDTLCSQLRIYISESNRISGDFLLCSNGRQMNEDEVLIGNEIFVTFPGEKVDRILQFTFLLFHIVPVTFLICQKSIGHVLIAEFVALLAFQIFKVAKRNQDKIPGWQGTKVSRKALTDFWELFLRSLKPSFRLEHLVKRE
jgi:hypothetical protein